MSNNRGNALANYNTSMAWNIMQQLKLPKGKTIGKHRKAFENNAGRGLKNTEYLPSTRHCPTHLYLSSSSPESKINLFFNKNKNKPILTPFSLTRKQVQNLPPVPELAKNRAQMWTWPSPGRAPAHRVLTAPSMSYLVLETVLPCNDTTIMFRRPELRDVKQLVNSDTAPEKH